jgi:NAD(P)-dependent dehydrogenase (short-subunit alcohol dehydrogenase family)
MGYLEKFSLKGKVALVTGATGILGQHFCRGLAEAGASVVVLDLQQETCTTFAQTLEREYKTACLGVACDVSNPSSVQSALANTLARFPTIHILHNNAATKSADLSAFFETFENYSLEEWRAIQAVNLDGMFLMAQAVGRQMLQQKIPGSIIQTASIYGIMGVDQRIYEGSEYLGRPINTPAVYSASKGGVVALTRYLATYWAQHGIRVNTLTPGGVYSSQNETFTQRYAQRVPLGRMAKAEELVGALLFLASDASSYVTGQNIVVDGGLSAW